MVQFNLLPDIKIQYLKARRQQHLVVMASTITIVVCVTMMVLLVSIVFGLQKKNISDLSGDIDVAANELNSTPDLTKMLTVQNQLRTLPGMHADKPAASRIFAYLNQSTPNNANISRLDVDFDLETITISGSAGNLETVNIYTDTLKFTNYQTEDTPEEGARAFSDVVLSSFARDNEGASYTITLNFDPVIFSESEEIEFVVPNRITTRSQTERPAALFSEPGTQPQEGEGGE